MTETYACITLDKDMIDAAYQRAQDLPEYNYSHRKLQANLIGCIGEMALGRYLRTKGVCFKDNRHETTHDFLISGSITLDIKTKDRTVRPKRNYDNSVPLYNHEHQRPHYYYFVSLLRNRQSVEENIYRFTHAFILGGINIEELEARGKVWQANETDPDNGTTFWTSCINVSMADLIANKDMVSLFKAAEPSGAPSCNAD